MRLIMLSAFCFISMAVAGQNYQALNGSSYAGSLGTGNNPASIVNTPWRWDLTVFGIQAKAVTNAMTVRDYSLISPPGDAVVQMNKKAQAKYANVNYNINLLNARFAINKQSAIAAGLNFRGYARANTSRFAWQDTLRTLDRWLFLNQNNIPLTGDVISSHWMELYGTYARTIFDNEQGRLNAGITLKVTRGLAGGYSNIRSGDIELVPNPGGTEPTYRIKGLAALYAYSSNFDKWNNDLSTNTNINNFISNSRGGLSFDFGLEYLIKEPGISSFNDDDDEYWDYKWKIGASLLDLGFNQYQYSRNSRLFADLKGNIEGTDFDQKFGSVKGIKGFNDSAASLFNTVRVPNGYFNMINPTRLVVNVDRWITQAFYVNGEVSLNLSQLAGKERLYMKEMNLLTITPRWETKQFGAYLPVQFNTEKKFWIGAAVKAGPVVFGLHNLGYFFSKKSIQNGGGYLALIIKPGKKRGSTSNEKKRKSNLRQYQCPVW